MITLTACVAPSIVPSVSPNTYRMGFQVRLTGLAGELAAESPFTIILKNPSGVIIHSSVESIANPALLAFQVDYGITNPVLPIVYGNYTVEVISSATTYSTTVSVSSPALASVTSTITNSSCGAANGEVDFSFSNQTPTSYTLHQDDYNNPVIQSGGVGANPFNLSGLLPGNYWIKFGYTISCTLNGLAISWTNSLLYSFTVGTTQTAITVDLLLLTNRDCEDTNGEMTVDGSGGTAPYTYEWTGPNGYTAIGSTISNLADVGDYTAKLTDVNGCVGYGTFHLDYVPGSCGGCYSLTKCDPGPLGAPVYYVYGNGIDKLVGYIINGVVIEGTYIDPVSCWTVAAIGDGNSVCMNSVAFQSYTTFFSTCELCKHVPVPEPEPRERVIPDPVHIYYEVKESACDINVMQRFASGIFSQVKKLKYGITDCCTSYNIPQLWVDHEINYLTSLELEGYDCREVTVSNCSWLPINGSELISDTYGGTSILAIAGEAISTGDLVMLLSDGMVYRNDPSDTSTYQRLIGIATADATTSQTVRVLITGNFILPTWTLTTGAIYYAGSNGSITSTVPTSGISQMIGIGVNATNLLLDIKQPNIL